MGTLEQLAPEQPTKDRPLALVRYFFSNEDRLYNGVLDSSRCYGVVSDFLFIGQ